MRAVRALVAFTALIAADGCDPVYTICAHVTRCSDGDPLVGVRVMFRYEGGKPISDEAVYTDPDGRACGGAMGDTSPPDVYLVDLEKPGYRESRYTVRGGMENPHLCLTEAACTPGTSESCACTDGGTGTRTCATDGSGFGECAACVAAADAGVD